MLLGLLDGIARLRDDSEATSVTAFLETIRGPAEAPDTEQNSGPSMIFTPSSGEELRRTTADTSGVSPAISAWVTVVGPIRSASRMAIGGVPVCSNGIHSFSSSASSAMMASSDRWVLNTGRAAATDGGADPRSRRASNQAEDIRTNNWRA